MGRISRASKSSKSRNYAEGYELQVDEPAPAPETTPSQEGESHHRWWSQQSEDQKGKEDVIGFGTEVRRQSCSGVSPRLVVDPVACVLCKTEH